MKVVRGLKADIVAASVVTLGMFDGVHHGHQALLAGCRQQAEARGLPAVALTYEPHPSALLRPADPIRLLSLLPEKLDLLRQFGMDVVVIPEFTREFSQQTPDEFIRNVLINCLHPQAVVAGYRTTFGKGRAGSAEILCGLGEQYGFAVAIVEPIEVAGGPVSSTRIRTCLAEGDVTLAAELLGYRYHLSGYVVQGDQRGRELGFPTLNLDVPIEKIVPADGVYVVDVTVSDAVYRGAMFIGNRDTFNRPRTVEVHLLDFTGDLYGVIITVTFLTRLRGIRPFPSAEALVAQITEDVKQAREWK